MAFAVPCTPNDSTPLPDNTQTPWDSLTTMIEAWPDWARCAWRLLTSRQTSRARTVWTTLVREYDGVVVGPAALVRHLVDRGRLGHRSTLETIALLVDRELVHARNAAEGTVLWVPEELMPEDASSRPRPEPGRPTFVATPYANGSPTAAQAHA